MRNQPRNEIFHTDDRVIGPGSAVRYRLMSLLFVLVSMAVLFRIGWIQTRLQASYLEALETTTVEYEIIPARDGRILTETDVLATDIDQYSVEVHYRWLELTPHDRWISRELRSLLSRSERSDAETVQQATEQIIQSRDSLWVNLQQLTGVSEQDLLQQRTAIQQRVTRIADSVNERHSATDQPQDDDLLTPDDDEGMLLKMATQIRRALTTPPHRVATERIVVREEEDYHVIARDVPLSIAAEIREHPERFPGTRILTGTKRQYPHGQLASHVIGARTPLTEEEADPLLKDVAIRSGNWISRRGRFGVEFSYQRQLHGTPGVRRITRNRRQEVVDVQEAREPVAGRDVLLTLNSTLQQHAENLLAEALMDADTQLLKSTDEETAEAAPQPVPVGGCVVVMEVNSGRILAAASAPTFDLALYTVADAEDWEQVNQDQRRPLFSRITGMALPPGSVFKPLTAVAAIENGSLNPAQPFFCQGFLNTPQEHRCLIFRLYGSGHGDITLQEALAQSCNVYFFDAARRMGIGPLIDWSERFEFGQATGIDLPFEVSGSLPAAPAPDANSSSSSRYERQALGLAIGQSRLTVTPLQMVRMMAAIANGGWLVTPHVVSKDGLARTTDDVETASAKIRRVRIPGLHPELLEPVREGLEAVVQQPDGTGYRTVRLDDVAIAGKSGTAETAPGKADHAWFAGYVPANEPQYAFAVVLEHGGSGSKSAGPVARELIRQIKDLQLLE